MFIFTILGILLFENRLVLPSTQWDTWSKRIKYLVKNQKKVQHLLKLFEKSD